MACQNKTSQGLSASSEMYLVQLARLEQEETPVPVRRLAEALGVLPVSANEMCRRLEDQGMLKYVPYHGARLLKAGRDVASAIQRRHRLWEVFLVDRLGLERSSADTMACELEHVTGPELESRLDTFLGHPERSPSGLPISSRSPSSNSVDLSTLAVGVRSTITELLGTEAVNAFLIKAGLEPGTEVRVCARCNHGTLLLVGGQQLTLSSELESGVRVTAE